MPTVTDDRDWSSKAAVTVWALKGLTQVAKTRLSLFALLALLLLLENLVAIVSSHSFFDLGSPGSSILGNLFPGFRSNVTLQCNFKRVFVTLLLVDLVSVDQEPMFLEFESWIISVSGMQSCHFTCRTWWR